MAELITMVKNSHRKIIMDWSPKAACSVMVAMFFDSMDIRQDINYTGFIHRYRGEVFYPRYGHVTMEELLDTSWYKFKVVRNPYARMVSSHMHVVGSKLQGKVSKHNATLQRLQGLSGSLIEIMISYSIRSSEWSISIPTSRQ